MKRLTLGIAVAVLEPSTEWTAMKTMSKLLVSARS